ncbi:MAG: CocE/NonD family hydrolase [Gammaproteobacteria bacterium]|nr:CocE/NonD family hydrolase [Gammaproteobacteria bacterium]
MSNKLLRKIIGLILISAVISVTSAKDKETVNKRADYIRSHYAKYEYQIPMSDGVKLFTSVYIPNDDSKKYPILMKRTPYRVAPYGLDKYKKSLGPSESFETEGYIFVFQDVRGKFMSEGEFINMRPQNAAKNNDIDADDATDTYDTIDWLVKNIPNNNGRVGMHGTSYPGYYASVGAINSHKALKAISPQAPIADWFFDDFHRNGAFVTPMAFIFFDTFDKQIKGQLGHWPENMKLSTHDGYEFFRSLGPLSNVNKKYFEGTRPFWNELTKHPNYDEYWKKRNVLQHLTKIKPAVLIVGGWFDTEDLYGPLSTYQTMSKNNKDEKVKIVLGPWSHGQWNSTKETNSLGEANFGLDSGKWFQENVQLPFFNHHLKNKKDLKIATATVFETGANRWRKFANWPPKNTKEHTLYFGANEKLLTQAESKTASSEFISDPNKPVPNTAYIDRGWSKNYMVEDQRYTARRPDVLVFETEVAEVDQTIAGAIDLNLWFSTSQSAADIVVKLVDVFPGKDVNTDKIDKNTGNRHELVRWGVIRGRFRNSMSQPEPFVSNQPTAVNFELYDVLHTIKRGHKLQIQIQSSMFPFIDRNPQKYVSNIFDAKEEDFVKAMHTIYHSEKYPSSLTFQTID